MVDQLPPANATYAQDFGEKSRLMGSPGRRLAILTCMDARKIRTHPLASPSVAIHGFIYHIHHGTLEPVAEANRIGTPASPSQ